MNLDFTLPCHVLDLNRNASECLIPCKAEVLLLTHYNNLNNMLEELLIEIFGRLPSKDAIRCKTVCKRWCSIISPNILQHHLVAFKYRPWCLKIEHQESRSLIDLSFLPFPKSEMQMVATYADLMLCCQHNKDLPCASSSINFYVVNLLTMQWIALPPAPPGLLVDSTVTGFICKPDYQSRSKAFRFRIVRIPEYHSKTPPRSEIKIQVFSSEKSEWKWFDISSPWMFKCGGFRHIVVYDGLLHWLNGDSVYVYDPFCDPQRFSRIISLPAKVSDRDCFGVSEGYLRIALLTSRHDPDGRKNPSISVWELENYNEANWCLHHRIYLKDLSFMGSPLELFHCQIQTLNCHIRVLAFDPADGNILYLAIGCYKVRYNMKKEAILDCTKEKNYTVSIFTLLPSFQLVVNRSRPTPLSSPPHYSEPDMQSKY